MSAEAGHRRRGVQIRHLLGFDAIVRTGSFRAAALDLGYAPTAISQQLAQLERLVGARLIDRAPGTGRIALTPAGRALTRHAGKIFERFEAARSDIASLPRARVVRVGACPSLAGRVLGETLAGACPSLDIRVIEKRTDERLLELLQRGELDVAFCTLPLPGGQVEWIEVLEDRLVLLVSVEDPIANSRDAPSPARLARMPLVGLEDAGTGALVADWLRSHGADAEPTVRCESSVTLHGVVAQGIGPAILPRSCTDPRHPGTAAIELAEAPARRLALCWQRERGRPVAAEPLADALRALLSGAG